MKRGIGGLWAVVGLLMAGTFLSAHHSVQAEFDLNKPLTMTGVVTKVEWINPHSYLYLDVKDDSGNTKHWAFEMAGPGALRRAGLSRADRGGLKAGDTITVNVDQAFLAFRRKMAASSRSGRQTRTPNRRGWR